MELESDIPSCLIFKPSISIPSLPNKDDERHVPQSIIQKEL
jgi:hypothetical protein